MHFRIQIYFPILLIIVLFLHGPVYAQQTSPDRGSQVFMDSINHRIEYLQAQLARLKQTRDVSYLNVQRELDHTQFVKSYEEYILDEDLEKAKELVEARIEKSEFRRDQSSIKYYYKYQEDIYALIKKQRMHYQQLFLKEKNFKKEFEAYTDVRTLTSYQKAQRMVKLALKYAQENNLTETIKYLSVYKSFTEALIFDYQSEYDLAELTNNIKSFEKAFLPLVSSDSINGIREAETLLAHCIDYGRLTGSSLNGEYFKKQEMMLTSALVRSARKRGKRERIGPVYRSIGYCKNRYA